ncbi:hypothetical protein [Caballeronia cordobensis]|uniref:hypothetical protein n=1 Tax=Caballeronia cordobensis TaxID=1353886 RepID=UPI00045F07BE|nr:hypothetical protein BRPE67_CCDS10700 [Burkholderia sp. RPE67]
MKRRARLVVCFGVVVAIVLAGVAALAFVLSADRPAARFQAPRTSLAHRAATNVFPRSRGTFLARSGASRNFRFFARFSGYQGSDYEGQD